MADYGEMFYGTLPQDTQDMDAVLRGVGRSLREIGRSTQYLPYDVQVYMNMRGIWAVTGEETSAFLFVVIEDDEPFGCNLIAASDDVILSGRIKYERMMKKYLEFKGRHDCYSPEIKTAKLPDWYMTKLIGGQNV